MDLFAKTIVKYIFICEKKTNKIKIIFNLDKNKKLNIRYFLTSIQRILKIIYILVSKHPEAKQIISNRDPKYLIINLFHQTDKRINVFIKRINTTNIGCMAWEKINIINKWLSDIDKVSLLEITNLFKEIDEITKNIYVNSTNYYIRSDLITFKNIFDICCLTSQHLNTFQDKISNNKVIKIMDEIIKELI